MKKEKVKQICIVYQKKLQIKKLMRNKKCEYRHDKTE